VSGDFDAGIAGTEIFYWNQITGENQLAVDLGDTATIHLNVIAKTVINNNEFTHVVAGDFDTGSAGVELFFWNSVTGENLLVADLNGAVTLRANVVSPTAINSDFSFIVAGDFDVGTAGDELFVWNSVTGKNRLVVDIDGAPLVTANVIAVGENRIVADVDGKITIRTNVLPPATIDASLYTRVVIGDFDTGTVGLELFFWNPVTGENLLVVDVAGTATVTANVILEASIDASAYTQVVVGDFVTATAGAELFFWNPVTGENLIAADLAGVVVPLTVNPVPTTALNGLDFTVVVAGDLDASVAGDELFFWNPLSGRNRLVADVDGAVTISTNLVSQLALNGNAVKDF
jgi:hypothetical protein